MAILATTATGQEILAMLEDPRTVKSETELEDLDRSFQEEGKTFHVFALFIGRWQSEIEDAITSLGHKYKWL